VVGSWRGWGGLGWLTGWQYRKSHEIIGSTAGAQTDYQIRIKIYYGSGTDSGENVYLNGKCRADFGDIRFTADDGETLLSYWMEEKVDGDYALFWVKIPSIPANPYTTTIYIYYGNPTATTTSNGFNTFLWFNDFETSIGFTRFPYDVAPFGDEDGVSPDTYSLEAGKLKAVQKVGGSHILALVSLPHDNVAISVKINFGSLESVEEIGISARYTKTDSIANQYYLRAIRHTGAGRYGLELVKNYGRAESILGTWSFTHSANTWYKIELRLYGSQLRAFQDGVERITATDTSIASGNELGVHSGYTISVLHYWDDFFVRKYVEPEPSHGAWGSEETAVIGTIHVVSQDYPLILVKKGSAQELRSKFSTT